MDALILSCGTGGGHNAACAAVAQALSDGGHKAVQLNPFSLKSAQAAAMVDQAYNALVQHVPSAFGMMYQIGNAYRKLPVSSPVYHANHLVAPLLLKHMEAHPYQAVVTTHLFPAEMLTVLKRGGHPLPPTFFIATDYTCIPFTEETDLDWYVIPAPELAPEFIARGIPEEKLLPFGIPVQRQYCEASSREEARKRLGFSPDEKIILTSGGCVGAGQLETAVSLLLAHYGEEVRVVVVCGRNEALYTRMREAFGEKCTLIGYTDRMADYIRACDLFLSKPGGLSSTEAAVLGTALIHITPIPGCENRNMQFFAERGMSLPVNDLQKELLPACDQLLSDASARALMRACQRDVLPPNAAAEIRRFIEKTCIA